MAVRTLEALEEVALVDVPHAHALVERAGGDVLGVGRDSNGRHAVLNSEREGVAAGLDIPETNGPVTASGGDSSAVASKIERVDILLVTGESVADGSGLDVPYLGPVSVMRQNYRCPFTYPDQLVLPPLISHKNKAITKQFHPVPGGDFLRTHLADNTAAS